MQNASHHSGQLANANKVANQAGQKVLPSALHDLVQLLAQIAVDRYLQEIHLHAGLPSEPQSTDLQTDKTEFVQSWANTHLINALTLNEGVTNERRK